MRRATGKTPPAVTPSSPGIPKLASGQRLRPLPPKTPRLILAGFAFHTHFRNSPIPALGPVEWHDGITFLVEHAGGTVERAQSMLVAFLR